MKKINILYWIITGLFAAYMVFTALPDAMNTSDALKFIGGLGYPHYMVPFLGIAKLLGVVAILIPGFPRVKEWAYAGLCFDLVGAAYSIVAMYGLHVSIVFMILPIVFLFWSYSLHHRKLQAN